MTAEVFPKIPFIYLIPQVSASIVLGTGLFLIKGDPPGVDYSIWGKLQQWRHLTGGSNLFVFTAAIAGSGFAAKAYYDTKVAMWLIAGGALLSVIPWTFTMRSTEFDLTDALKDLGVGRQQNH